MSEFSKFFLRRAFWQIDFSLVSQKNPKILSFKKFKNISKMKKIMKKITMDFQKARETIFAFDFNLFIHQGDFSSSQPLGKWWFKTKVKKETHILKDQAIDLITLQKIPRKKIALESKRFGRNLFPNFILKGSKFSIGPSSERSRKWVN